jgi:hypothetical protein
VQVLASLRLFQQCAELAAAEQAALEGWIAAIDGAGGAVLQLQRGDVAVASGASALDGAFSRPGALPALPKFESSLPPQASVLAATAERPPPSSKTESLKREKYGSCDNGSLNGSLNCCINGSLVHRYARFVELIAGSLSVQAGVEQEFARLVHIVRSVEALTDPHDVQYVADQAGEPRVRTNAVTLADLANRMVRHVEDDLGGDTEHDEPTACAIFAIFQKLAEGEHDVAGVAPTLLGGASDETADISLLSSLLCDVYAGARNAVEDWQRPCSAPGDGGLVTGLLKGAVSEWAKRRPPPLKVLRWKCLRALDSAPWLFLMLTMVVVALFLGTPAAFGVTQVRGTRTAQVNYNALTKRVPRRSRCTRSWESSSRTRLCAWHAWGRDCSSPTPSACSSCCAASPIWPCTSESLTSSSAAAARTPSPPRAPAAACAECGSCACSGS